MSELEKVIAEKNNVSDPVNHPPHYTQGKIEVIDIIEVLTEGYTGYQGYLVGNVVKYIARANFKGNKAEDIQKSQFYLNKLVKEIERRETQSK